MFNFSIKIFSIFIHRWIITFMSLRSFHIFILFIYLFIFVVFIFFVIYHKILAFSEIPPVCFFFLMIGTARKWKVFSFDSSHFDAIGI